MQLQLPSSDSLQARLARRWLITGVGALALAGLFAVLLVAARTPQVQQMIPYKDFFHTALVVHVDLSVLVWFLAFAGMLWSLVTPVWWAMLAHTAWGCFAAGTVLLALSPFLGAGDPLMNNYIPVLQHPLFFVALSLLACGMVFQAVHALVGKWNTPLQFGLRSAAIITLVAMGAFVWSSAQLPDTLTGEGFYESLFWGGGHVLQFTYVQVLLVVWVMLVAGCQRPVASEKIVYALLGFGLLAVVVTPYAYAVHDVLDVSHTEFFTLQMRHAGGTAPAILTLLVLYALIKHRPSLTPEISCLISSLVLFAAGGLIGLMISGVNVTIPAHYHGSIVGVTLAFMGCVYFLLPTLGYAAVTTRWAVWQPIIYGVGQLMHIAGLAYSGGYGVARKSTADVSGIDGVQVALGMMGLGGLLAIIGGLIFVVVVGRKILSRP